jgi:hypothetical protein
LRDAVHYNWAIPIAQMDSIEAPLARAHVDFEQVYPYALPSYLPKARVVIYTPPAGPASMSESLSAWLGLGGKVLVTHSYLPLSADNGQATMVLAPGIAGAVKAGQSPAFALLPQFVGLRVADSGRWLLSPQIADKAEVLLGTADEPLLSRIDLPKGSCILYVHTRPQDLTPDQLNVVIEKLIQVAHLPRIAATDAALGDPVMTYRFQHGATEVLSMWNRARIAVRPEKAPVSVSRARHEVRSEDYCEQTGNLQGVWFPGQYRANDQCRLR